MLLRLNHARYGMADNRIGVARLDLPDILPTVEVADSPGAKT